MESFLETDALELALKYFEAKKCKETTEEGHAFVDLSIQSLKQSIARARKKNFTLETLSELQLVGEGSYGYIWSCTVNAKKAALKQSKKNINATAADHFIERNMLLELKHPNVVELLGCLFDGDYFSLYEYCQGDTGAYCSMIPKNQLGTMVLQVFSAISFIHERNIIHRDIKPENILIADNNQVKLGDFGSAKKLHEGFQTLVSPNHAGTFCYCPPETIDKKEFSKQSDIYSFGVVIFEWDTRKPFMYPRTQNKDGCPAYYMSVHSDGRPKETYVNEKWVSLKNKCGMVLREPLMERVKKSNFRPILEAMFNTDMHKRPLVPQIMELEMFMDCLNTIRELGRKETECNIISDGGTMQRGVLRTPERVFKKSDCSIQKLQALLGFYYEDPEFFAPTLQQIGRQEIKSLGPEKPEQATGSINICNSGHLKEFDDKHTQSEFPVTERMPPIMFCKETQCSSFLGGEILSKTMDNQTQWSNQRLEREENTGASLTDIVVSRMQYVTNGRNDIFDQVTASKENYPNTKITLKQRLVNHRKKYLILKTSSKIRDVKMQNKNKNLLRKSCKTKSLDGSDRSRQRKSHMSYQTFSKRQNKPTKCSQSKYEESSSEKQNRKKRRKYNDIFMNGTTRRQHDPYAYEATNCIKLKRGSTSSSPGKSSPDSDSRWLLEERKHFRRQRDEKPEKGGQELPGETGNYNEFPCSQCKKGFGTGRDLMRHKKDHLVLLACSLCGRQFTTKAFLKTHILNDHRHHSPISCPVCKKKCIDRKQYQNHLLRECKNHPGGRSN